MRNITGNFPYHVMLRSDLWRAESNQATKYLLFDPLPDRVPQVDTIV